MSFVNVSAYKFLSLNEECLSEWQQKLLRLTQALHIKGTILLSHEGINLFIAGTRDAIDEFKLQLLSSPFQGLNFKESLSAEIPYKRIFVKIKAELISMGHPEVEPATMTVPHLPPEEFKRWYDEGVDMLVLDARNDYEYDIGHFESAMALDIETFRDFPEAVTKLAEQCRNKLIVTYCTGGIRCEKAGEFMRQQGFNNIYQLDGGIINYFAKCGEAHYEGECFVFDKRVAVDPQLQETDTIMCFSCGKPIQKTQQSASGICPHCQRSRAGKRHNPVNVNV